MPKGASYERANILCKKSNIHKNLKHSACLHMQPKLFLVPSSLFLAAPKNPHHHHWVFFFEVSTRRNKNGNKNICTSISWAIGFHMKNCNFFALYFFSSWLQQNKRQHVAPFEFSFCCFSGPSGRFTAHTFLAFLHIFSPFVCAWIETLFFISNLGSLIVLSLVIYHH